VDLLEIAPLGLAAWEEIEGVVVITRPRRPGVKAWLQRLMSPSKLRLDGRGSFVWRRLDGATTVAAIVDEMRAELGGEDLEQRVGHFVRALRAEGMVAYPGWDDPH
jgi:hypothetical protein